MQVHMDFIEPALASMGCTIYELALISLGNAFCPCQLIKAVHSPCQQTTPQSGVSFGRVVPLQTDELPSSRRLLPPCPIS